MSSHWLRAPSAPLVGPSVPKTHKSNNWLEVPTTPLVWPEVPTTHFDPAARPKIQNVALHWLNRRYHVEATVPHPDPEAREWATIVYTTYQQPGGDTYVQAKFLYTRPFKPIVLRQRSRNDEDTVMVPLAGGLPDDAEVMEGTEPITIVLYEGAAGVFHVWKEGETTQSVVRFASTHAAFTAIHNWTTKQADILPVRATQVPAADTLGFRANVTLRYSARAPIFEPNPRKVMTRYLHIVVDADGDEKVTGCYKEVWSKSRLGLEWDYRIRVSEAGGYSGGDNGLIKSSVATRYRMYDWAEKKGVLLHDYPNDKWYHLDVRKRSMVSHVRAHMEFKAPMKEGDNQQWECVRTGFHAGANTVAMFVRLDENKTVRKVSLLVDE
ncbi:hypothetical protein BDV95DRAFT_579300 [Massariosphaeria phaeospora]|uniref:Uncharacterized protein n=1 Tax=Massariosphaeria phaeospora TaxID=100035 RepID=A0A7C8M522_9PLEO|nr:hypothetical protein BDV95DRAFT_579300 [Massariosphaeria phaeospora]